MIDYGKQKSTVRPEELELTETKVFVSSKRMLILKMKLHRHRLLCVKSMK